MRINDNHDNGIWSFLFFAGVSMAISGIWMECEWLFDIGMNDAHGSFRTVAVSGTNVLEVPIINMKPRSILWGASPCKRWPNIWYLVPPSNGSWNSQSWSAWVVWESEIHGNYGEEWVWDGCMGNYGDIIGWYGIYCGLIWSDMVYRGL